MTGETVIKNGTVVTESGSFQGSVYIKDEKIKAIGDHESFSSPGTIIDAEGKLVMPGMVDPHVHLDDVFTMDSYESGSSAAALGGITTFIDFAWQGWVDETTPWGSAEEAPSLTQAVARKKSKASEVLVDYGLHASVTREDIRVFEELRDILADGITSIKMLTINGVGISNGFMDSVFRFLADKGAVAMVHTEDPSVCGHLTEKFQREGKTDFVWFPESRPDYTEAMAADDAVQMAIESGCKYYGVHTTSKKAADVLVSSQLKHGKELVRAETCTHYMKFTEEIYEDEEKAPLGKIIPPLRTDADAESLLEYVMTGTLDVVSTDHGSYSRADKTKSENWWDVAPGSPSLQYSLPVFHDLAVNSGRMSYSELVQVMAYNPAQLFGLPEKGSLEPGTDADIVIFDPDKEFVVNSKNNAAAADYSLYEGQKLTGAVDKTFVRGELVADNGHIVAEPGHGHFLERELPDWDF
ncbi:dihydroorotase [Halopelagius longus]|uniref:Allantoinase n=1 Tax=Halopelagius longus TaxID=1236180 RepID=A0A1H1GVB0_9EURY|nr:amidohydrolase family protein [Halopelagius longus]RDI69540.1 allantoinase [Halopelagius longus]SDR17117.1 dihydropyrimidinase [Halopelagius longus]